MADTMGQHNQLRYRGYVYDPETELYFLNSRFYDPETGRFLNADALTSTGGLLGNNMFTYCVNNPVLLCDPNGMASAACISNSFDDFSQPWKEKPGGGGSYYGRSSSVSHKPNLPEPKKLSFWEFIFNEDEQVVLDAECFAFYKGVLVIKSNALGTGAASFGVIILGDGNTATNGGIETVKHEYGHFVHYSELGSADYFLTTAIWSLWGAELTNQGVYPTKYYYDLPWERVADMYGGVERNYLPGTNENASTFLLITKIIGRLTPW